MNIFIKLLIALSILFLSVGCQTNNSDRLATELPDGNVTDPTNPTAEPTVEPTVVPTEEPTVEPTEEPTVEPTVEPEEEVISVILPVDTAIVKVNSATVTINVTVIDDKNNPYSSGSVKIIYPDDVRQGRDVGYFSETVVTPVNGVAKFVYTAPSDLSVNTADLVFKFYHDSNPTEEVTYTIKIQPDPGQTILTNYTLATGDPNDITMPLESNKKVSYIVYDENNKEVADSDIISIDVTSLNPTIGTLKDNSDRAGTTLDFDVNNVTINVVSYRKSGIVPLEVVAVFNDVNGDQQTITKVFNMIVLSGPPSAISLSYAGTTQAAERAKFIEKWIVTVTDKYSNYVDNQPAISAGMIAGYAKRAVTPASPQPNYLQYDPDTSESGTMTPTANTFTAGTASFDNIDLSNDILVTYGTGYKYEASGKWDIETLTSSTVLGIESYNGATTTDMGFAVGNNQREDTCRIGAKWLANVYAENDDYILADTGTLALNVEYDYYLVGKSTMLWVNLVGSQDGNLTRLGEAKKITLRGQGITGPGSYEIPKDSTRTITMYFNVANTSENYRNANLYYEIKTGGGASLVSYSDSDGNVSICRPYVTVTVATSVDEAGTVELQNLLVTPEF